MLTFAINAVSIVLLEYHGWFWMCSQCPLDTYPFFFCFWTAGASIAGSGGQFHSCALQSAGSLMCCGSNTYGQLGTGDTVDRLTPTAVSVGVGTPARRPTCSFQSAILSRLWFYLLAVQVPLPSAWPQGTRTLARFWGAGPSRAGATTAKDSLEPGIRRTGSPLCLWISAQVVTSRCTVHSRCRDTLFHFYAFHDFQLCILSLFRRALCNYCILAHVWKMPVVAIAAGSSHTCAVLSGGGLRCWGSNLFGQLGTGDTMSKITPTTVKTGDCKSVLAL